MSAQKQRFGLHWLVYAGDIDVLIPVMIKGVVDAWWTIVKRGSLCYNYAIF